MKSSSTVRPKDLWYLYGRALDLSEFYHRHPGGPVLLESSRGLDITPAYECYHKSGHRMLYSGLLASLEVTPQPPMQSWPKSVRNTIDFQYDCAFMHDLRNRCWAVCTKEDRACLWAEYDRCVFLAGLAYLVALYAMISCAHTSVVVLAALGLAMCRTVLAGAGHAYAHSQYHVLGSSLLELSWITSADKYRSQHCFQHHCFTNIKGLDSDHDDLNVQLPSMGLRQAALLLFVYPAGNLKPWKRMWMNLRDGKLRFFDGLARLFVLAEPLVLLSLRPVASVLWLLQLFVFIFWYHSVVLAGHSDERTTEFPHMYKQRKCGPSGCRGSCWAVHQLETTNDFTMTGLFKLDALLTLGLNLQRAHHLFPTLSPFHLRKANEVLEEVCTKHGVNLASTRSIQSCMRSVAKAYSTKDPNRAKCNKKRT